MYDVVAQKEVREGFGVQIFPSKAIYMGYWKDNKANGKGLILQPNDTYFMSYFKDNQNSSHVYFSYLHGYI